MVSTTFFALLAASFAVATPLSRQLTGNTTEVPLVTKAVAVMTGFGSDANGTVYFTQTTPDGPVNVTGTIFNLDPNAWRGFHIHQYGDLTNGCDSTGGHYNPFNQTHGGRYSAVRHAGDLGNIQSDNDGTAEFSFTANMLDLSAEYSIIGRAIVVHAGTDDLGLGKTANSSINGNSGARIACGVIGLTPSGM
ncbi:copper/zinc binding superoxide dismutase [Pluteus cervinus]|uniref:Copper/zinc binding superoxide dismutase n=1 Tax=Pluteus cervinus TaxID=181527 RepID=A0ACD3B9Y9_9AGAR|nr:copper/zinc binding superoxide dismutase [Pluteus cervinus]